VKNSTLYKKICISAHRRVRASHRSGNRSRH
jgi:hypothetical protein